MFIPDPGSGTKTFPDPDPHPKEKKLSILNQKTVSKRSQKYDSKYAPRIQS
jgi:hypothetical protein